MSKILDRNQILAENKQETVLDTAALEIMQAVDSTAVTDYIRTSFLVTIKDIIKNQSKRLHETKILTTKESPTTDLQLKHKTVLKKATSALKKLTKGQ